MKKYRYFSTLCLAAVLVLAACTQDTLTDSTDTLPEGMYPLQIASVTMEAESSVEPWGAKSPQTRVAESADRNSSVWQDDDKINVQIGNGTPGVYTYRDGKLEVANGDAPAYWASTDNGQTITAWYTSSSSKTVDLSKQINTLAYVLTARKTADFNKPVSLAFSHALAKIRLVLEGNADGVTDVKIKTRTSCTLKADGTLTAGSTEDFIPMVKIDYNGKNCWEANVVPGYEIQDINVDDVAATLTQTVTPVTGKYHEITIKVNKAYNPDELPGTITDGEYVVSGTGTKGITISGGSPTITFRDVNLTAETAINITGGSPKLVFDGNTTCKSTGEGKGAISLSNGASVEISGSGSLNLEANTSDYFGDTWDEGAIIGSAGGANSSNISISNIALNIKANSFNSAIGSGDNSSCGNITITNATVKISGCNGGAGIGTSMADKGTSSCGDIKIINSDIEISYGNYSASQGSAIGCAAPSGNNNVVNSIFITLKSGQSKSDFLNKLTTTSATGSDKVGQGYREGANQKSGTITNGIHWKNADGSDAN